LRYRCPRFLKSSDIPENGDRKEGMVILPCDKHWLYKRE
jgi:hypothetical protein